MSQFSLYYQTSPFVPGVPGAFRNFDQGCVGPPTYSLPLVSLLTSRHCRFKAMPHQLFFIAAALAALAAAQPLPCRRFADIYADGRALCETMFGAAFRYEVAEAAAYTMWFFDAAHNPNNAVRRRTKKKESKQETMLEYEEQKE